MSLVLLPLHPLPYSVLNLITPTSLSPLWISLKTAFAATIYAVFMGTAAARWMLTYRGRVKGTIDGIFTLPLVLPPTVVGFLLLLLLGRNSPVGQLLQQLGLSVVFTPTAAVIASTVVAFPLMYKTTLSAFEQVDPRFAQLRPYFRGFGMETLLASASASCSIGCRRRDNFSVC